MLKRRDRGDEGATAVEFALVVIPFLVLTIGMVQYGWYFYVSQSTGGAASNVVRRLQVGDCWGAGEALAKAREQAPMVSNVVIVKDPTTASTPPEPGTALTVTVTADAEIIGFLPMPNGGLIEKSVQARAEDETPSAGGC